MDLFWVFGSVAIFGMIVYAAQILAVHLTLRSPKNPCPKPDASQLSSHLNPQAPERAGGQSLR